MRREQFDLEDFEIDQADEVYFPRAKASAIETGFARATRTEESLNEDPWEAERKRIRHCPAMTAFRRHD